MLDTVTAHVVCGLIVCVCKTSKIIAVCLLPLGKKTHARYSIIATLTAGSRSPGLHRGTGMQSRVAPSAPTAGC